MFAAEFGTTQVHQLVLAADSDQLEELAALRQQGVVDDDELQRMNARVAVS